MWHFLHISHSKWFPTHLSSDLWAVPWLLRSSQPPTGAWPMASSAGASTMDMAWPLSLVSLWQEKLISKYELVEITTGIYITKADLLGYSWRAPYVLAALPGLLVSVLILVTFRWIIIRSLVTGDNKISTLQRSKTERYQGDSSGWVEQAERRLQEVDHWVSQEAACDLLLSHHDDSAGGRWWQQTNLATIDHLMSINAFEHGPRHVTARLNILILDTTFT